MEGEQPGSIRFRHEHHDGQQDNDRGEGKAATDQRLAREGTLHVKQLQEREEHGRLHGDAAECGHNQCFRILRNVQARS